MCPALLIFPPQAPAKITLWRAANHAFGLFGGILSGRTAGRDEDNTAEKISPRSKGILITAAASAASAAIAATAVTAIAA